jgi:signal transduction histidine kinase
MKILSIKKLLFRQEKNKSGGKVGEASSIELGKEFIANASHELRTPVTIIKGFAETLRDIPEMSEEMFDSILEKILRNCERMELLVKNLLLLADLDHLGDIKKESCNLSFLVEHASYQILSVSPDAYIETLQNKDEIMIEGNNGLLDLAIINLLQNAVKYSKDNPHITVTIEDKVDSVFFSIEDKGIGIASENIPYIFDRFYTVNKSHARRLGGAGLGLSMVKIILEKHGAWIKVKSELGKGTKFMVEFSKG